MPYSDLSINILPFVVMLWSREETDIVITWNCSDLLICYPQCLLETWGEITWKMLPYVCNWNPVHSLTPHSSRVLSYVSTTSIPGFPITSPKLEGIMIPLGVNMCVLSDGLVSHPGCIPSWDRCCFLHYWSCEQINYLGGYILWA